MKILKRIVLIFFDILIVFLVGGWLYQLYEEFLSLPKETELMKFTIFQIKLILFTLFLISSVTFLWFTNFNKEKKDERDFNFIKGELSEIIKLISTKSEEICFPEVSNLKISLSSELERINEAKKIDDIFNLLFKLVEKVSSSKQY